MKEEKAQLIYIHRSFLRLRTLSDDLQGRRYRGLAEIPILAWIIIVQKLQEAWHVHVIIIVEMAKPPETCNKNMNIMEMSSPAILYNLGEIYINFILYSLVINILLDTRRYHNSCYIYCCRSNVVRCTQRNII